MNPLYRSLAGFAFAQLVAHGALAAEQESADLLHRPLNLKALHDTERLASTSDPHLAPDAAAPAQSPSQAPVIKTESLFSFTYLKLVADDVKETFTAPASWGTSEWLTFSGVAAGLAGLTFLDTDIRDAVQRNRSQTLDDISRAIEPFGAEYSFGVLGAFYLGGELLHDETAKATALDGLSASFISGLLIVEPLKYTVGRARPSQGPSDHFAPFSSDQSFPSGHATQAFAVATVISEHYESIWVRTISYGLAGMVGFARMEQNAHWASDVAAGAVIGTFVGHVVVHFNQQHRAVRIEPVLGPRAQAIQLSLSF